jgi:ABC-2 type transport system ATP-binding protein
MTPPAIAVEQLVKIYPRGMAVDGITFALPSGSVTGLLGGNGAGKTTTIAMIMGLLTPTSGTVRVLGAEMPNQRYRVLHRVNFESPYVENADAADGPPESHGMGFPGAGSAP